MTSLPPGLAMADGSSSSSSPGASARGARVLLGMCGSVAAIKAREIVQGLEARLPAVEVRVVLTAASRHFASDALLVGLNAAVFTDADEWVCARQPDAKRKGMHSA